MSSRVVTRYGINWNVKLEGPSLDTESRSVVLLGLRTFKAHLRILVCAFIFCIYEHKTDNLTTCPIYEGAIYHTIPVYYKFSR